MTGNNSSVTFSYLPLLIRLRCLEYTELPAFLGSTLHGIVGWSLMSNKKVYQYLYENRRQSGGFDIVNPYLIEPPLQQAAYQSGDELRFQLILLGDASEYAGEVIEALTHNRIFELGAGRRKFELFEILHGQELYAVWKPEHGIIQSPSSIGLPCFKPFECSYCSIQLLTPLRIRRNGELLRQLDFPTIIRNITRRLTELTNRYGGKILAEEVERVVSHAADIKMTASSLYVKELCRYSSRKDEKVDLSGMLGTMTFEGEIAPFVPWLNAAQILHLGRNVTFGCGMIHVVYG